MISYPYIEDLFGSVLKHSKAIKGNFIVSYNSLHNLNYEDFAKLVEDKVAKTGKKYPVAILSAPVSYPGDNLEEFESYIFSLFFLKQTYKQGEQMNESTATSNHKVLHDWHDMKRCAKNFILVLGEVTNDPETSQYFRLLSVDKYTPVSMIGVDQISGVRLDFKGLLFSGCELEDYDNNVLDEFQLPVGDSHPEHKM